jgi:DNA-binding HxlR family transcriptional regulator
MKLLLSYTEAVSLKRRYGDGCGVANALDVIGERWSLLLVRDLLFGPKRFTDIQAGLPGAGPNILAQRLRELESAGVVQRRTLPPPAGSQVYELTDWGAELDPVVSTLGRWGARSPIVAQEGSVGADSVMLALRNGFEPQPERPWTATYEISLGRDRFTIRVLDGDLAEVLRGQPRDPETTIETDPTTLGQLLARHRTLEDTIDADDLTLDGDADSARRLLAATRI